MTDTLYTCDATGRLKTVTDPKNQVTTHTYATAAVVRRWASLGVVGRRAVVVSAR